MNRKPSSIIGNLGWWLVAEILVFTTALLLMSYFAFSSFSNAYLSAFMLIIVVVMAFVLRKQIREKANSG
jgi:hypothetical protein